MSSFSYPAAEIRSCGFLALLDNATPDRPGPREKLEKTFAVAIADHALKRAEILVEPAEHFEHCFLVVEKYIAPHRRIGGGDPGEVTKPSGGKLDDFGSRHFFDVSGGADDIVGDEMRHMASDRQHQIVMRGLHDFDIRASSGPKSREAGDGLGIGPLRRRQYAPAIQKKRRKPGLGT